jgi:TPR repeat protein
MVSRFLARTARMLAGLALMAAPVVAVAPLASAQVASVEDEARAQEATGDALLRLGREYAAGTYGAPDFERASELYLQAADAGTAEAYADAAMLRATGKVTSGDEAEDNIGASYLYMAGAEAGCIACMTSLARMYEMAPIGIERNLAEALVWYTKAYEMSIFKTDAEFENIKRVSSEAYYAAVDERDAGNHWEAYNAFETLCNFKGPAACYMLGLYQGAGNSPYGKDERAALAPLAFACDNSVPKACEDHARLTGFVGPSAGYSNGYRAERYFKSQCDSDTPDYSACFNVAWLNYYTDYGLNNWQTIRTYSTKACFQGGDSMGCSLAMKMANMMGPPPGSQPTQSGGNWGRSVDNAIGGIFAALASGASAYASTGSVGSSGSYSSSSSSSSSGNVSTWQDNRDWNDALRATANIGTAYSSSCRPGNKYC